MEGYGQEELQILCTIMERWIEKVYVDFGKQYELTPEQQAAIDTYQTFIQEQLQGAEEYEEE